ncbi:hypothetical protein GCM10010345_13640 [Streptomyces canarius]|uniref:Uncharacterized protein n=1 Tax=Streptomyces canarius TaxID=285453 RepID=A0ABQ3CFN4_9ACTN|nr:hypothetical protein GCM10010345_13640 [Streptomyces canarius]
MSTLPHPARHFGTPEPQERTPRLPHPTCPAVRGAHRPERRPCESAGVPHGEEPAAQRAVTGNKGLEHLPAGRRPAARRTRDGAETTQEERKPAWRQVLERRGLQDVELLILPPVSDVTRVLPPRPTPRAGTPPPRCPAT